MKIDRPTMDSVRILTSRCNIRIRLNQTIYTPHQSAMVQIGKLASDQLVIFQCSLFHAMKCLAFTDPPPSKSNSSSIGSLVVTHIFVFDRTPTIHVALKINAASNQKISKCILALSLCVCVAMKIARNCCVAHW